MENLIQIKGMGSLDEKEKKRANELLKEYYPKIQRKVRNLTALKVHFKEYKKEGSRKKYSITIRIDAPTEMIEISTSDWDFARTLHKALNKIMNRIEHKLHSSEQY